MYSKFFEAFHSAGPPHTRDFRNNPSPPIPPPPQSPKFEIEEQRKVRNYIPSGTFVLASV